MMLICINLLSIHLNFFTKNVLPGGKIVCDDYNVSAFPGAKKAWDEFFFKGKKQYTFSMKYH